MNLAEFYAARLDELEAKMKEAAYAGDPQQRDYFMNCGDGNESYMILQAEERLEEVAAGRELLKIHNTWAVRYNRVQDVDQACVGCNLDSGGAWSTPDVNQCPTLLAMTARWKKREDYPT